MNEKIKMSWRFGVANWILCGSLKKVIVEVIDNLEIFLSISNWPTEPGVYVDIAPIENQLLVRSVDILLAYLTKNEGSFRFWLANFVCKHKLREMLKTAMYSIFDTTESIVSNDWSVGFDSIRAVRFSLAYVKCIIDDI